MEADAKRTDDTKRCQFQSGVQAMLMFGRYFKGSFFMIWTDYNALKWILRITNAPEKLAWRRLMLSEFDFPVSSPELKKTNQWLIVVPANRWKQ